MMREDGRGAPEEGGFDTPEGLGQEATHLPASLMSIDP
jgi:hypothetical protein